MRYVLPIYVALLTIFLCTKTSESDCGLDFTLNPYSPSGSCLTSDGRSRQVSWRGMNSEPCCMDANLAFAQSLAVKANRTGGTAPIFLDTDEMLACADILIHAHPELSDCSFYQFTKSGAGLCYNETVVDIANKLGLHLNALKTICSHGALNLTNSIDCTNCYGNFSDEVRVLTSILSGGSYLIETDQDCGMALLIAMYSSRIDDSKSIRVLSACLVYQHLDNTEVNSPKTKGAVNLTAILAAGVVLCCIALFLVVTIYFCLPKRVKKGKAGKGETKALDSDGSALIRFSGEEISNAMNYTSPWAFLGEGSTGNVYKGRLPSGQFIAIKHICKNVQEVDAFEMEIETLSKIRHKNLVSLLGYCDEDGEKYFVYEYCANGNLSQMLLGLKDKALTWMQRVKIAHDCVAGLRFLHLYPDGCIVHRDIKPTNILLTESMEAKLADFGLLRIFKIQETNVFTAVKGTLGYLDPEYASKGRLTSSSDIYGFGIVLLQLLSGRRAIDLDLSHRESLVKKAQKVSQENPIDPSKYADPRLSGEYSREAFAILLRLAVLCTASSSQGRPILSEVYGEIQKALQISTSVYM